MDFLNRIRQILKISSVSTFISDLNKTLNADFEITNNVIRNTEYGSTDIFLYSKKFNTIISIDNASGYPRLSYSNNETIPGIGKFSENSEFNFYNPKPSILLTNEDIYNGINKKKVE